MSKSSRERHLSRFIKPKPKKVKPTKVKKQKKARKPRTPAVTTLPSSIIAGWNPHTLAGVQSSTLF